MRTFLPMPHVAVLIIAILIAISFCSSIAANGVCFNIAFIVGSKFGSSIMRGYMVANALVRRNSSLCVKVKVFLTPHKSNKLAGFLQADNRIAACVFVKRFYHDIASTCRGSYAFVFEDVLDNPSTAQEMIHHILHNRSSSMPPRVYKSYLVQSTYLAAALSRKNISAYYYPHHHSNNFSVQSLKAVINKMPLVVGYLSGSPSNIPDLSKFILPAVCAVENTVFNTINQQIEELDILRSSYVNSTLTSYDCRKDEQGQYISRVSKHYTYLDLLYDRYQQAAYYLDESLSESDIGLVWTNRHISPEDMWNFEMVRPPTRMLHWMSRGVPVIYFPTHSYSDIAIVNDYEEGLGFRLSAHNETTLSCVLERLRDVSLRQLLSQRALKIAARYTVDEIAHSLVMIVLKHSIFCFCRRGLNSRQFACVPNSNIPSHDKLLCKQLKAYYEMNYLDSLSC